MLSERIKRLTPYTPGEQPQDRQYLKLNTNENPYPPSPRIEAFLKECDIEKLRLYPDPSFNALREKIAEKQEVRKENVFVGNGSDEVLSFAFYAFFDSRNGNLLFPEFTYSFYPVYCDFYDIEYQKVPLKTDFSIEVDDLLKGASCGIIFPNPNAPTGICLPFEKIEYLLENYAQHVVVIDEAYIDFGGESAVRLIDNYENLLVIRTFSKGMSLAGIRLGFAMGSEKLTNALFMAKDSFNSYPAGMLAQKIGEIATNDDAYYKAVNQKIIATRERFSAELERLGWRLLPSSANFVFAGKQGLSGEDIYLRLKQRGILVRYFHIEGIKDFVRITIGKPEDMNRLLEDIREIGGI